MYKLTKDEKETIISFNEAETTATVYTCSSQIKKRLQELSLKSSDIYREKKYKYSQTYIIPKKIIKFGFPRELSEKERQKRATRLQQNVEQYKSQKFKRREMI